MKKLFALMAIVIAAALIFAACPTEADDSGGGKKTAKIDFTNPADIIGEHDWGSVAEGTDAYELLVQKALEILGTMNEVKGLAIEFVNNVKVTVSDTIEAAAGFDSTIPLIDLSGAGTLEIAPGANIIMNTSGVAINSDGAKIEILGTIDAQDIAIQSNAEILVKGKAAAINGIVDGDLKVDNNAELTVREAYTTTVNNLTVRSAGAVSVEGELVNTGVIYNYGVIHNNGTFVNTGTIYNIGGGSITGTSPGGSIFNVTAISSAEITVTAPAGSAAPNAIASVSGASFSAGTVTWSPSTSTFTAGTQYTASVVLTVNSGYIFTPATTAKINNQSVTITNFSVTSITISRTFTATGSGGGTVVLKVADDFTMYSMGFYSEIVALCYTNDTSNNDCSTWNTIPINLGSVDANDYCYCIVTIPAYTRICFKNSNGTYTAWFSLTGMTGNWTIFVEGIGGGHWWLYEGHV